MTMSNDFVSWVAEYKEEMGWSDSELARRMGVHPSTVSRVLNRERKVSYDFCVGLARILKLPIEDTLRRAGLLPVLPPQVAETEEAARLFNVLSPERRSIVLDILRGMVGLQRPAGLPPIVHLDDKLTDVERCQIAAWLKPILMDETTWQQTVQRYTEIFDATPDALKESLIYAIGRAVTNIMAQRPNHATSVTQGDESADGTTKTQMGGQ